MNWHYLSIPQLGITGVSSTYITIIGAICAVIGVLWWKSCPKWAAVIVAILAVAAALSTPVFGPWLQGYLHSVTSGFLGRAG